MGKFEEFIEKQKEQAPFVNEKIEKFKEYIQDFYSKINNEWLAPFIADGSITKDTKIIKIREESLGIYEIPSESILIGGEMISFIPVGTLLLGTDARIDMTYGSESIKVIRVGSNIKQAMDIIDVRITGEPKQKKKKTGEIVWKFVNNDFERSYTPVTAQTMQENIMKLING